VLKAYDISGKSYSRDSIDVKIGNENRVSITLNNFDDVDRIWDRKLRDKIDGILNYSTYVGNVEYIDEYSIEASIYGDYDLKETLFGLKEVNHRWCYMIRLGAFQDSAYAVGRACAKAVNEAQFMQEYFMNIKKSFIQELSKVTGIKATVK